MSEVNELNRTPEIDLIWGVDEIARACGLINKDGSIKRRKAYWLLENNLIPAKRIGRRYCASRTRLRAHLTSEIA